MYSQLEELLAAGKWREANQETWAVMSKDIGNKLQSSSLPIEVLDTTLNDINSLWTKHSNNHFGFSVQKRIWDEICSDPNLDRSGWASTNDTSLHEAYYRFMCRIGWYKGHYSSDSPFCFESSAIEDDPKLFSLEAPQGHLPMFKSWDITNVDYYYKRQAYPYILKYMSIFFAHIPQVEE
jgi:hypothetical protein